MYRRHPYKLKPLKSRFPTFYPDSAREKNSMIKHFVLGISAILMLSGFAAAQKVAGAWRLDGIKTAGTDAKAVKFTNPNIYLFTKGHFSVIRVEGDNNPKRQRG